MSDADLSVEARLVQVFDHLGIRSAHVGGRLPGDWSALAATRPDIMASFTLLAPTAMVAQQVEAIASKLLVVSGDEGSFAQSVQGVAAQVPGAQVSTLAGFSNLGWLDVAADYTDEIAAAMLDFLAAADPAAAWKAGPPTDQSGEIAGITYRIEGSGPPLVLLPLFLAPSQWDPLVPKLSERFTTIVLGGTHLGAVAILEARARAEGYLQMIKTLIAEVRLQPGESVLEVGSGTGVLDRWLVKHTDGANPVTGVDINPYLLKEAAALAATDGMTDAIEFKAGSGEALPFADNSFDVTMSVTVMEEVNPDRMLPEMVRVTRPGGRVAVIVRAMDVPFMMNLTLPDDLKAKVQAPGVIGTVAEGGCADASLYRRLKQAGLSHLRAFPQIPAIDAASPLVLQFMQSNLLGKLTPDETEQWHAARAIAEEEGTFFMAWPHHCAVGTKV